jgi:hypothetical protein
MRDIKRVRLGLAEITELEHIIDCDANPHVPDGWSILPDDEQFPNRVRGAFQWNAEGVTLHLDKQQKNGKLIGGNKLREALAGKPVLNACVLDYLIANPHLIPEEWKGEAVFFWGTIYSHPDGCLCVCCLIWDGVRWRSGFNWLGGGWRGDSPAAVDAR